MLYKNIKLIDYVEMIKDLDIKQMITQDKLCLFRTMNSLFLSTVLGTFDL